MVPLVGGVIWILAVAQHMGGGITYAKFTKKNDENKPSFFLDFIKLMQLY